MILTAIVGSRRRVGNHREGQGRERQVVERPPPTFCLVVGDGIGHQGTHIKALESPRARGRE